MLRHQQAKLLELFLASPGQLLSIEKIAETLWRDRVVDYKNGIRVGIAHLRSDMGIAPGDIQILATEVGRGYRFLPTVRIEDEESEPVPVRSRYQLPGLIGAFMVAIFLTGSAGPTENSGRHSTGPEGVVTGFQPGHHAADLDFLQASGLPDIFPAKIAGFRRIVSRHPDYAPAWYEIASLLMSQPEHASASEIFSTINRAISLSPDTARFYELRAKAWWMLARNWRRAGEDFEQAVALDPSSTSLRMQLARYYTFSGQFEKASREIHLAAKKDPQAVWARSDVSWLFTLAGNFGAAEMACQKLDASHKNHLHTDRCYIDLNLALNKPAEAARWMASYLQKQQPGLLEERLQSERRSPDSIARIFWKTQAEMEEFASPILSPVVIFRAIAHVHLGEADKAAQILRAAYDTGNYFVPFILRMKEFDQLDIGIRLDSSDVRSKA